MEGSFTLASAIESVIPLFSGFWDLATSNPLGVAFIGLCGFGIGCRVYHKIKGC